MVTVEEIANSVRALSYQFPPRYVNGFAALYPSTLWFLHATDPLLNPTIHSIPYASTRVLQAAVRWGPSISLILKKKLK